MVQKIYLIGLLTLLVVVGSLFTANGNVVPSQSSTATRNVSLPDYKARGFPFDCSGKPDGDYPHPDPKQCTRFVSCVGGTHAYEWTCKPANQDGSLLHFDPCARKCNYPYIAGCNLPCDP